MAAILGMGLLYYQQIFLKKKFQNETRIENELQSIQRDLISLQYLALQASYFLYFNNDSIDEKIKSIKRSINKLKYDKTFQSSDFFISAKKFKVFEQQFKILNKTVIEFLTLNASIKNSTVYLPTLGLKVFETFDVSDANKHEINQLFAKINARVFLTKSALDSSFIEELKDYQERLEKIESSLANRKQKQLLQTALRHLNIFIDYFPYFQKDMHDIINSSAFDALFRTIKLFKGEIAKNHESINTFSQLFLLLYLISILFVLYFIFHSEKENIKLREMQEALKRSLVTDALTGLGNRELYNSERHTFKHPAMVLFNIDKFKHVNEFYGGEIGDAILKQIAERLKNNFSEKFPEAKFYRLGGDDFAIVFEFVSMTHLEEIIQIVLELFNNQTFITKGISVDITVSAGASHANKLFETADMALKHAKQSKRERYAIYNPKLDASEKIAKNINELKQLNQAIENDGIVPYFQPIFDLETNKIVKYESLARLVVSEKEVLSPFFFLQAAKEAKISSVITSIILEKTLKKAQESGESFSVNISPDEIEKPDDIFVILSMLSRYKDVSNLITFEILESEEIEDYDVLLDFVKEVKKFGCKIAIDDFGSGYSNFEKLLKMEVDLLKIDGTLIKDIDHDKHAEMVVRTIRDFAKSANINTVAEYVHSKEVLEKVKSLGIEMGQGFYLGKPMPDIIK
jgi:diguanylate cyclase (GGDEF)-like protein